MPKEAPKPGTRWRHLKRGTVYTVKAMAIFQSSARRDELEGRACVVYEGENGMTWVRDVREFEDGRFEKVG